MPSFVEQPCEWNDVKYPSIKAAAEANYITPNGMWHRIKEGYTCDADLDKPPANSRECEWNGKRYKSIRAAARALGISPTAMWFRLERGLTCDADLFGCRSNVLREQGHE